MSCLQITWDKLNFMLKYMARWALAWQEDVWLTLYTRYIEWTMLPESSFSLLDNPVEVEAWMRSCQCAVSWYPYKANMSAECSASEHLRRWMHLSKLKGIEALVWVRMEKSRCLAKALRKDFDLDISGEWACIFPAFSGFGQARNIVKK